MDAEQHEHSPLQSYFDWQVTTIMLARDLQNPLRQGDETAAAARRRDTEDEVRAFTLALIPQQYKDDPSLDWPESLLREITKATLRRAADIAGA